MTLEEFQERILALPQATIRVLNALDCRRLGLMSTDVTARYLAEVREELSKLEPNASPREVEEALRMAWDAWHVACLDSDARSPVDATSYASIGTVLAFGAFFASYTNVFTEAQKYFDQSGLSRLSGLIGRDNILRRLTEPQGLSGEEVDACIAAIQAAAVSGKVALVKHAEGKVWVAPKREGASRAATDVRDSLGLDHLPRKGETRPESTTLMRIEFDSNELAAKIELRRPCVFDYPGLRFRALTAQECTAECGSPRPHGYTVYLGSMGYADGQAELTYTSTRDSEFLGWSVSRLDGRLSSLHPDADKHQEFAEHLLAREPKPSSAGAYRRQPWGLAAELGALFAGEPGAMGEHSGNA